MTVDGAAHDEAAEERTPARRTGAIGRWTRRCVARWRPILLTVLLIAALGNAARIFYFDYRPDLQTDRAAAHQVIRAASDGAVALLSYSPETLDRDFANAKSRLTEDYLAYYQRFADQVVGPSAQRGQVTTTASVVKAAVSELQANSAVVLVFIKQKTTSKAKPEPVVTSSSLKVAMEKVKGSWLIDKFDVL
ncbi:twin-arginine translocation pathway signal [Mycobacterium sp. 1081908.1]|uniref:twin-arginine translocation pathway signal n=1 Tax=Mycobacterium sp. 1081908.1 TaxID=1834066 RepID=UPI0007FD1090|nr:twin-arginine translocation pathway signal [Mycobacterium sp. 1081908.1]OBK47562.1 twin-arginine translocation pathway signal [Mycobacterium sp. 1081908.1]